MVTNDSDIYMDLLSSIFKIVLIDLVLSGDNAVVIGMAAHRLPPRQRKFAILFGGGAAIVLRIALTMIAALLLQISGLQLLGGALLIWIGFKLLKEEEESHEGMKVAASMREAIFTILIADFIMSTDNVLGVAGASNGSLKLLFFGLIFSMAILMWMGSLVANLINRFWWLSYAGAAVIAWTGATMIFGDSYVVAHVKWLSPSITYVTSALITIAVPAFAHWFHRVRGG
ncbi:MAG: tellurium resistance protein TerC [Acidobacteria bacterium]|nr:MAG: tellurium resistance protein TerC [Acidobacteriota bacterium]